MTKNNRKFFYHFKTISGLSGRCCCCRFWWPGHFDSTKLIFVEATTTTTTTKRRRKKTIIVAVCFVFCLATRSCFLDVKQMKQKNFNEKKTNDDHHLKINEQWRIFWNEEEEEEPFFMPNLCIIMIITEKKRDRPNTFNSLSLSL